jgi:hypothetical protein
MSKIEELTAASDSADREMQRQAETLQRLRSELEKISDSDDSDIDVRVYSDRQARIEILESKVATAVAKARGCRDALDTAREAEAAKLRAEQAQRTYDYRLADLNATQAEISSKQSAIRDLQSEIPRLQSRLSVLLFELDKAKSALQQSEVTA